MNVAVLMGRLTADPELKYTQNNIACCKFTIAVNRQYSKEQKQADFINILAWRQTAEFVSKYFTKGQMIAVQGKIQTGSYDKNGEKRYTFEVVADNVSFCESKNRTQVTNEDYEEIVATDDLPF